MSHHTQPLTYLSGSSPSLRPACPTTNCTVVSGSLCHQQVLLLAPASPAPLSFSCFSGLLLLLLCLIPSQPISQSPFLFGFFQVVLSDSYLHCPFPFWGHQPHQGLGGLTQCDLVCFSNYIKNNLWTTSWGGPPKCSPRLSAWLLKGPRSCVVTCLCFCPLLGCSQGQGCLGESTAPAAAGEGVQR